MIVRSLVCLLLLTSNAFAVDWTLLPERSKLTFEGTQAGTAFEGTFTDFTTKIHLDPDHLDAASISVEIATKSAHTGSAERDGALPGTDWFDVDTHPTATFASSSISTAEAGYVAEGTLTIKGTALAVPLPFSLNIDGDEAMASGSLTIDRDDFGIGTGPLSPMVGKDVTISFELVATR